MTRALYVIFLAGILSGCETTQTVSYQPVSNQPQTAQDAKRQHCQGVMAGAMVGTKNFGDGLAKATEAFNKCMLQ